MDATDVATAEKKAPGSVREKKKKKKKWLLLSVSFPDQPSSGTIDDPSTNCSPGQLSRLLRTRRH